MLPLLPVDMTGFRAYVAFPFGVAGPALGVIGCLSVLGMIMVAKAVVPH